MYMFDLNWCHDWPIVAPIVVQIQIIYYVHSNVSYQWVIYQKYDRHGHESPGGYGV